MDKETITRRFANHKATFTDYGNIKILDFKKPNSCEDRIRFMFEEDYCRLHISGSFGELIATNYNNMTYEKFNDFTKDVWYLKSKVNCHSEPFYYYDEDSIKEDLIKLINESNECSCLEDILSDYRPDWDCDSTDEELLEELLDEILSGFSEETGIGPEGQQIFVEYITRFYFDYSEIGKRSTGILDLYVTAFKLAQEDLEKQRLAKTSDND